MFHEANEVKGWVLDGTPRFGAIQNAEGAHQNDKFISFMECEENLIYPELIKAN